MERIGWLVVSANGRPVGTATLLGLVYEVYTHEEDAIRVAAAFTSRKRRVVRVRLFTETPER